MDALALLTADHNRLRGVFSRFQQAEENDQASEMAELCELMIRELEVHTSIEEEIFYPAVRRLSEELSSEVAEGIEEHHVVDSLAAEIKTVKPGAEEWVAKVTVLIESVEHHAGEEEELMFPKVRSSMDKQSLDELAAAMEGRKTELGAPTSADKEHLSLEQLRSLAAEQEIPGRSSMNRDELVATVGIH